MDDLGNYIYIIMIAVAAISSILKSINKKKEKKAEPEEDLGDILKEIFSDKNQEYAPQQSQPEPVFETVVSESKQSTSAYKNFEGYYNYDNTKDVSKLKSKKEVINHFKSEIKSNEIKSEEVDSAIKLTTQDEVRSAFIASEIFNRKY